MKCVCPMGGDRTCPDDCLLAVWANLPATDRKTRRKPIAVQLYKQGFTQEQIATQLGVSHQTIGRDIEGLSMMDKPPRPKGGRPPGKRQATRRTGPDPAIEQQLAEAVLDEGMTLERAAEAFDLSSVQHVKLAVAREEGRREVVPPQITPAMLSMTAQQKLDIAIRQEKARLGAEFRDTVNKRVREFLEETILPKHREEQQQAKKVMDARKGIMDKATFKLIWSALHPDSRKSISDRKLAEAFDAFSRMEKLLLAEVNSPTDWQGLPRTMAEWDLAKQKATAARKAKREANSQPLRRT